MSDGGLTTAAVGNFNVTTNSGISEADLTANLKPAADKAASEAASQLGRRGAAASAKARSERAEQEEATETTSTEEKPAPRQIKPIPPKEAKPAAEEEPEPVKAEGEEEPEPEQKPKDKRGDPRHDPNARVKEATREAAEAKRQLAAERQLREAQEQRIAALEARFLRERDDMESRQPPQQGKTQADPKPQVADFESYEDYLDARDSYNRKQWESELFQRAHQAQQQEHQTRSLHQAVGRFREAAATVVAQISEEVGNLRTEFQLSPGEQPSGENWIANELVFSPESAPALMLHLSEHPEDLQRIAALPTPRAVSREMAKLEARLDAATTAPAPSAKREQVSRATPPVRPVTGQPYVTEQSEYREGMTLDEYYALQKRLRR